MAAIEEFRRPPAITVLAVLGFVQGVFLMLGGLALLLDRNDSSLQEYIDLSSDGIVWTTVIGIVLGAITFLIALGLWAGSDAARALLGIVEAFHVIGGVFLLIVGGGTYFWDGIFQIALGILILFLLFNARSDEYFER